MRQSYSCGTDVILLRDAERNATDSGQQLCHTLKDETAQRQHILPGQSGNGQFRTGTIPAQIALRSNDDYVLASGRKHGITKPENQIAA